MQKIPKACVVFRDGVCDLHKGILTSFPCVLALFHSQTHFNLSSKQNFQFQYGFANIDDALTQFDHMLQMRPLPPILRFNQLLNSIARSKHYSTAISLMFRHLGTPQPSLPSSRGFCLNGNMASADKFFDEIVEKGFQPNFITYGTIMNGLCKIGNTSAAILLLRKMEEIGGYEPGLVECSMVIDSLCKGTLVTEALKLFLEMIGKVDALCKEGKAKEAQAVVQLIIQRGVVPDVVTYSAVMDGYCLCGQVGEARKMFDIMVSRGCGLNVFTYNILINGYCKIKNIDEAMNLFKEMSQKGLFTDTITYTTLICSLCQTRRPQDAILLLDEMQTHGQIPDLFTYSTLLDGLCNN
ncbi:hypothetical protein HYC85_030242 [Camellia sinensis]|uniref:Pentacotripeptide-repeat region of PRORP domain-containing protein n=1 Tax=Camellia sinensis TaxID=4442 RepID=A0A7J7G1M4_CAMSI|nr:hypothetical protein HYC85_030242 [Camellia sinensis]